MKSEEINRLNLDVKKAQLPTRGIKHYDLSGYASILPRIKFGLFGQESSPQSLTFHTPKRYLNWQVTQRLKIRVIISQPIQYLQFHHFAPMKMVMKA